MLAPLKDRSMIGAVAPATSAAPHCDTKSEIEDLHRALKESRDRLRRGAWESTRQISRLNAEVSRLQALCANYEARLERDATERAFVEPAQALMRCSDSNECLMNSIHQVWLLEKNIGAAHREYQKLAAERDALVQQLHQTRLAPLSARSGGGK